MTTETLSMQAFSQQKHEKILEAAQTRFLYYGVRKTTMRDIANDLGVAVSNLYLYFQNKQEIVLAIAEQCRQEQQTTAEQVLADVSLKPVEKLEAMFIQKFRMIERFRHEYPKGRELIAYLLELHPERHILWQERFEGMIAAVLADGVQQGYFKPMAIAGNARMIRLATAQYFFPACVELLTPTTEEDLRELTRWIIRLIERPECRKSETPDETP